MQELRQDELWRKLQMLDGIQRKVVLAFIDSLLETKATDSPRKHQLLSLSRWTEEDIRQIGIADGRRTTGEVSPGRPDRRVESQRR